MKDFNSIGLKDITSHLPGPIFIFGAGGFVGFNLFLTLLKYRSDVYGLSRDWEKNWRFQKKSLPQKNCINLDLTKKRSVKNVIQTHRPQIVFNLAAYGAYSYQKNIRKIYQTNFNSHIDLVETLKGNNFHAYIYTGSNSEYGLNCRAPRENSELIPNSHYAISKAAVAQSISYYGQVEKLPVIHTRLYSVYGPWEEPTRLIPTLIQKAIDRHFPNFVNPDISRDFVYVDDVVEALISLAASIGKQYFGKIYNIGTGKKTTIRQLADLAKNLFNIPGQPQFATMPNRDWDLRDWYSNSEKINKDFNWKYKTGLAQGLKKTYKWQKEI
jgi:nucleoside-diphosphate-sugar epimerase